MLMCAIVFVTLEKGFERCTAKKNDDGTPVMTKVSIAAMSFRVLRTMGVACFCVGLIIFQSLVTELVKKHDIVTAAPTAAPTT